MKARPRTRTRLVRVREMWKPAIGQRSVVSRTHDQVPATLGPVGAGDAKVGDPAEPHVIDSADDPGASSYGTSSTIGPRSVDEADEVNRVAVRGQEQRRRVHQVGEQQDGVVLGPIDRKPRCNAATDAPGTALMNASTPCTMRSTHRARR